MKKIDRKVGSMAMAVMMSGMLGVSLLAFTGCAENKEPEIDWSQKGTPTELIVRQNPTKMDYLQDDIFVADGLVIDAVYEDGSIQENVEYKIKSQDGLKVGEQRICIAYSGAVCYLNVMVNYKGNAERYSVANTPALTSSALEGKTIFWLGSSVTYGEGGCGESMVDFIAKRNGATCIKEAISGTTLRIKGDDISYVERLEAWLASDEKAESLDAFVCQLSTNDMYFEDKFGEMTPDSVKELSSFNTKTTFGAIEYIIALVKEKYDCPILFYTNQDIQKENYEVMVDALNGIEAKWGITILDLYHDQDVNAITEEEATLYLRDTIHPTRAGYLEWWTPIFEEQLKEII